MTAKQKLADQEFERAFDALEKAQEALFNTPTSNKKAYSKAIGVCTSATRVYFKAATARSKSGLPYDIEQDLQGLPHYDVL